MKKFPKRSLAILLALVMLLALSAVPAFAIDPPTSSSTLSTPAEVTSITIGGATAYYKQDNNGSTKFIRAELSSGSTEYDLRNADIVINLVSSGTTVSSPSLTFSGDGTTTRTVDDADLFNEAYSVTIGTTTYTMAAGLDYATYGGDGDTVSLDASDPWKVAITFSGQGSAADIEGFCVQNPFMGNSYYSEWTCINYYVDEELDSAPGNRSAVGGVMTKDGSAAISGCATHVSGDNYTFNLSSAVPAMTVTYSGEGRLYRMFVSAPGDVDIIFGMNFTEAYDYGGSVRSEALSIEADLEDYFGVSAVNHNVQAEISVPSGTTVMDVLETFTNDMGYADATSGASYISSIKGLAAFDGGYYSGWMYMDDDYTWNCIVPPVGADDYELTVDDTTIIWFYTTDYMDHFGP